MTARYRVTEVDEDGRETIYDVSVPPRSFNASVVFVQRIDPIPLSELRRIFATKPKEEDQC